jgi:hypothetical protein
MSDVENEVVESVLEENAEEVVESAPEESTEEVVETSPEEVAPEEAAEEVVEAAPEEVAEEAAEEVVESAPEETAEEVVEPAPQEVPSTQEVVQNVQEMLTTEPAVSSDSASLEERVKVLEERLDNLINYFNNLNRLRINIDF